eukprot:Pgem_evm1s15709
MHFLSILSLFLLALKANTATLNGNNEAIVKNTDLNNDELTGNLRLIAGIVNKEISKIANPIIIDTPEKEKADHVDFSVTSIEGVPSVQLDHLALSNLKCGGWFCSEPSAALSFDINAKELAANLLVEFDRGLTALIMTDRMIPIILKNLDFGIKNLGAKLDFGFTKVVISTKEIDPSDVVLTWGKFDIGKITFPEKCRIPGCNVPAKINNFFLINNEHFQNCIKKVVIQQVNKAIKTTAPFELKYFETLRK